jgi:F-type H+-transporting ATPase subunit epsilon
MGDHPLFGVDVVTPESIVWQGDAEMVIARTTEGEIGIMAGHEATMAALSTGVVEIRGETGTTLVGIHGGFLQIFQNQVTLLTDRAEISEGERADAARLAAQLESLGDSD